MVPRAAKYLSPVFNTSPKYQLSQKLADIFQYSARNNTKGERASDTIDIVSPDLCDDVLDYMGHTLEGYQGCDIIDIHPGACLWSQKLHDVLKPRRHLLMEPEEKYKPFIDPLVQQPESAYRHTTLSGAHPRSYFESYDRIFNDELLPKRQLLPAGDPRLRQTNKTLLVTGTLSRRYRSVRGKTNNVHNANLLLNHMVHASQTNALFHGYGLVRMLFWHPEDTKQTVLPDMAVARGGYCAALEAAAELTEIAGKDRELAMAEPDSKRLLNRFRYPEVDQVGADRVLEKMNSRGISLPSHRRGVFHQAALDRKANVALDLAVDAQRTVPIHPPDHASLEEAITTYETSVKHFKDAMMRAKQPVLSLPYKYKFTGNAKKLFSEGDLTRIGPLMDLWGVQLALEAALAAHTLEAVDKASPALKERLRVLALELRNTLSEKRLGAKHVRSHTHTLQTELQAFHTGVLAYDRRPFEALAAKGEEFWPQFGLFLLDVQPRSESLADDLISPTEANTTMRELITHLWQLSASSVPTVVGRLGSNAAQDLIPAAPDIADAGKGGRLDVEDMPVRLLSRDMIAQLTSAYLEWPFRSDDVPLEVE